MFEEGTDIEEELIDIINPDNFVKEMLKIGEIDKIEKEYSSNVYRLCRNSIAWVIGQLRATPYIYDLLIIEGCFKGKDHAWMQFGDYYFDITVNQFIDSPKFAVIHIKDGNKIGYQPDTTFSVVDWVKTQK